MSSSPNGTRQVLVASGNGFVRNALRVIFRRQFPAYQLQEFSTAATALAGLQAPLKPALVLMDAALLADEDGTLAALVRSFGARSLVLSPADLDLARLANDLPGRIDQALHSLARPLPDPARGLTATPAPTPLSLPLVRIAPGIGPAIPRVVLVGASTGGPTALTALLQALPPGPLPWVVAQHMPAHGTASFAEHLREVTGRAVCEVTAAGPLAGGTVHILGGGRDYRLASNSEGELRLKLADDIDSPFHPNADCLLNSAAEAGIACTAIILSGMGRDGAEGARHLAAQGCAVYVQELASCVVGGMPGAVLETTRTAIPIDPALPPESLRRLSAGRTP